MYICFSVIFLIEILIGTLGTKEDDKDTRISEPRGIQGITPCMRTSSTHPYILELHQRLLVILCQLLPHRGKEN